MHKLNLSAAVVRISDDNTTHLFDVNYILRLLQRNKRNKRIDMNESNCKHQQRKILTCHTIWQLYELFVSLSVCVCLLFASDESKLNKSVKIIVFILLKSRIFRIQYTIYTIHNIKEHGFFSISCLKFQRTKL